MRVTLMASLAILGLTAAAASAQTSTTQSPPSSTAASQQPQPSNSLPAGAATSVLSTPGSAIGGTGAANTAGSAAAVPMMPMHSMHGRHSMMRRHQPASDTTSSADSASGDQSAPPSSSYRGGVGSPLSMRATDMTPSRGEHIGARLPNPGAAENDPHDLLLAAQRNLSQGKTGATQQALEMAETRVLSRTTLPSDASQPDQGALVQNISQARRALGSHDMNGAKHAIEAALQEQVPPPGPAVTTVPAGTAPGQSF